MVLQAKLILRVITLWFLVLSQFFRDGIGPFKCDDSHKLCINLTFLTLIKVVLCNLAVLQYYIKLGKF